MILVAGGGPAGASAATLLARRGHEVRLLTRPLPPAGWLAESIPASARKLLARAGALEAVEAAGFVANRGNTIWWGGTPERIEPFGEGAAGFHADRAGLESALLALAREAGVDVRAGGPVRAVRREGDGWRVETRGAAHRGRWLLDASGRAGVLARRELRTREPETSTLALVGRWERAGGREEADGSHTWIESYRDGWAWSVPVGPTTRCVTAMVDPRRTALAREAGLGGMLDGELDKAARLGARLEGWRRRGRPRACPASLYGAAAYGEAEAPGRPGWLLLGDAGSFIDPLSSYGVKKALASGWLAALVVHTALTDPGLAGAAVELFDAREREVYRTYRALSIPFFEEADAAHPHPFWRVRLEAARAGGGWRGDTEGAAGREGADPADRTAGLDPAEAFARDPAVRAAFEEMRARPSLDVRPGPTLATILRPTIAGDRIALEPHLTSERLPGGSRFVGGIDLRRLVELAPGHDQVPDVWEAYNVAGETGEAAPLPRFLTALSVAVAAGFLELADRGP